MAPFLPFAFNLAKKGFALLKDKSKDKTAPTLDRLISSPSETDRVSIPRAEYDRYVQMDLISRSHL